MYDTTGRDNQKTQERTITQAWIETLTNGGGTFDAKTREPVSFADGYVVGIGELGRAHTHTSALLASVWPTDGLVGTWIHEGELIVDRVVYTPFDVIARELQRISSELCVYDCKTGETIDLLAGE